MIRSDKDGPAESPALSPAAGSILKPAGGGIPSASLKPLKAIALHTYVACSLKTSQSSEQYTRPRKEPRFYGARSLLLTHHPHTAKKNPTCKRSSVYYC